MAIDLLNLPGRMVRSSLRSLEMNNGAFKILTKDVNIRVIKELDYLDLLQDIIVILLLMTSF